MKFDITTSRLRIGTRLGAGFAVIALLLLGCAGFGIWQLRHLGATVEQLLDVPVQRTLLAMQLETTVEQIGVRIRNAALQQDEALRQRDLAQLDSLRQQSARQRDALRATLTDGRDVALQQAIEQGESSYLRALDAAVEAVRRSDTAAAIGVITDPKVREIRQGYTDALHQLVQRERAAMEAERQATQATRLQGEQLLAAAAALGALLAAGIGWSLTASIITPTREAIATAERIAAGDLSQHLTVQREDELGDLLQALQHMQERLRDLVWRIHQGAEQVHAASHEIAQGNQDLARRTEEEASAIEETASAVRQMSDSVGHNVDSARQASEMARMAASVAEAGGTAVGEVVATMNEISQSSHRIGDIVGVIDGLAFQTNILALNASVEAARAGDQGRGFAVVAEEVRSLAQRSAAAAREIKALIGQSVDRVESGHALVQRAGETMRDIVAQVQAVTGLITQIDQCAREQGAAIEQVNLAVLQLDRSTQQNAALVEQSAASAASLNTQAARLEEHVQVFHLPATPATTRGSVPGTHSGVTAGVGHALAA